ncbi:Mycothiol maleylpyruvate isomerase N-terminal domain-containing protein [Algoriphagus locisalis]|uniref:Mycothiol maleylpyruvate isomerase N-terminal domain-containing protein n=1 Tax=Algoriphagus locisalis TaxID=305507 RepID=A0A1I6XCX4_9BACT|nr:maleylpyruvate isomerase N-terminal domain-containing protein [Algoriphagus locisalis]SFT36119.1 Mycothiol maleylpyruvate isomerase N-terminal domain-containing protein [Algoriphagus locisalis]
MNSPEKIDVIASMPELDKMLFKLLEGLSAEDWERQTIAPKWKVKDIAVHLLDGNLRTLSMLRDNYYGEKASTINSYQDLIDFLNQLNADWVTAAKRLSPKVIIDLLKLSGKEYCDFLATLNPDDKADFSVAWAGENESKNWFHIAREYTEKWHHQQQIRLALGEEKVLLKEKWYLPYLDTSVRALPHHYRNVEGTAKDLVKFTFFAATEKSWFLRYDNGWELFTSVNEIPTSEVKIRNEDAWKIFTKGMTREEAIASSEIIGNKRLGEKIFDMIAVMA